MRKMTITHWILIWSILSWALPVPDSTAQEINVQERNAAVNYWQAFSLMPKLTEEERQLRESVQGEYSAELPEVVKQLTERSGLALAALEIANRIQYCDWQLDYSQGPMLLLPHVQEARELGRQVQLRAQYRFSQGENSGGVADLLASCRLAGAIGKNQLLISLLVQAAIERGATNLGAAYLPQLSEVERRQLLEGWQELGNSTLVEALIIEKNVFGGWLQSELERVAAGKGPDDPADEFFKSLGGLMDPQLDREGQKKFLELGNRINIAMVRKAVEEYLADCDELVRFAGLGFAERRTAIERFEKELEGAELSENLLGRQLSQMLLPFVSKVADTEESWLARRKLFEAAVRGIGGGEAGIAAAAKDLGIEIVYQSIPEGFELSTPLTKEGVVEKLQFGGGYQAGK